MSAPIERAATLLLYDTHDRVVLLGRSRRLGFLPSVYVFPGGRVVEADQRLAEAHGAPRGAFRVAAVRETFEETGVLVGTDRPAPPGLDATGWRARIEREPESFAELLAHLDARLQLDRLRAFDRWRTPPMEPRRYDTRFYALPLPDGAQPTCDGSEAVSVLQVTARDALDSHARGALPFAPPTLHVLAGIERHRCVERYLASRPSSGHAAIEPRLVPSDDGVPRLVLPGHPDFGDDTPAVDPPRAFRLSERGWEFTRGALRPPS